MIRQLTIHRIDKTLDDVTHRASISPAKTSLKVVEQVIRSLIIARKSREGRKGIVILPKMFHVNNGGKYRSSEVDDKTSARLPS